MEDQDKKNPIKVKLILEDGTEFIGESFGAVKESFGEVVFNTGMTGYQEILSDPSYCGQLVTMTYPLIGNYGINKEDFESLKPFVGGFIVREYCDQPSNYRSEKTLHQLLTEFDIPAIQGIDTRKLTKILRKNGTMKGIMVPCLENSEKDGSIIDSKERDKLAKDRLRNPLATNQVEQVSTKSQFKCPGKGHRIVLVDFGYKHGILRSLINKGCEVLVVPHDAKFEEIKALSPDGIVLSNGPGDPKDVPQALGLITQLQEKYPIMGICLGHQVFALANGADTEKMKFGHRGCNHPVKDLETGKVFISSQNHGYTVMEETTLDTDLEVSFINVNDNTVEGLKHKKYPAFSVQFHPEASPGPSDTEYLFDQFLLTIKVIKDAEGKALEGQLPLPVGGVI